MVFEYYNDSKRISANDRDRIEVEDKQCFHPSELEMIEKNT